MFFSKSFGYALRGILYIAMVRTEKERVQVDEIARELSAPKHFLGKIMKKVVQHGILNSTKGPYGGFSINEKTLATHLSVLYTLTNSEAQFDNCVLGLKKCNADHPCPLHGKIQPYKEELQQVFTGTTIGDLLNPGNMGLVKNQISD